MPVYHVSEFDVSAVQIDLSANAFNADTIFADYWVHIDNIDFNIDQAQIGDDGFLTDLFKECVSNSDIDTAAVFRSATRTNIFDTGNLNALPNISFKDLGVININNDEKFDSNIYNIGGLAENNLDTTSFNGKVNAILESRQIVTGIRERMIASINTTNEPQLSITDPVPGGSQFGFLIVRNLNLAGTSQDQTIHIGVVLEQTNGGSGGS